MQKIILSSSRLDNLAMVHAALSFNTVQSDAIKVAAFFDNEAVLKTGSRFRGINPLAGKNSNSLEGREELFRAYANSFMISADLAHAVHPILAENTTHK